MRTWRAITNYSGQSDTQSVHMDTRWTIHNCSGHSDKQPNNLQTWSAATHSCWGHSDTQSNRLQTWSAAIHNCWGQTDKQFNHLRTWRAIYTFSSNHTFAFLTTHTHFAEARRRTVEPYAYPLSNWTLLPNHIKHGIAQTHEVFLNRCYETQKSRVHFILSMAWHFKVG